MPKPTLPEERSLSIKKVLENLCAIRDEKVRVVECFGICYDLHNSGTPYDTTESIIAKACDGWKHYSGNISHPINHPRMSSDIGYQFTDNKWDRKTAYGKRRWELVDRMIKACQDELGISHG